MLALGCGGGGGRGAKTRAAAGGAEHTLTHSASFATPNRRYISRAYALHTLTHTYCTLAVSARWAAAANRRRRRFT